MTITTITSLEQLVLPDNCQAVLFDCFGTLMEITYKAKPYGKMLEYIGKEWAKENKTLDKKHTAHFVMSQSVMLSQMFDDFNVPYNAQVMQECEAALYQELFSVKTFDDTNSTILNLQNQNIKVGMCSNLAMPYGIAAQSKTIPLDYYFFSYEMDCIKPESKIYLQSAEEMNVAPENIVFVGDTLDADYHGPIAAGLQAVLIKRK